MNKNQNGFGIVEFLIVFIVLVIIGSIGWFIKSGKDKETTPEPTVTQQQSVQKDQESDKDEEVPYIKASFEEKLSKLPDDTPSGFIIAFREKLENYTSVDEYGCGSTFSVDKVSSVNVKASLVWVEWKNGAIVEDSMICGGGLPSIWALDSDKWVEVSSSAEGTNCSKLVSPKVYSEFVENCWSSPEQNVSIPNPNGSITFAR